MSSKGYRKKLFFFTHCYPYGLGELWKTNELKYLTKYFAQVTVVPFTSEGDNTSPKSLPSGVKCEKPLFPERNLILGPLSILRILDQHLLFYSREFFRKRVYQSKSKYIAWLGASIQIKDLLKHPTISRIMDGLDDETVLYYFWGKGSCDMLPFVGSCDKTVVRMHGYDLFEERSGGYIPYRKPLLEHATLVAPTSESGERYLRRLYPKADARISPLRCGVVGRGDSLMSEDATLRLISCSFLLPVKRVNLLIDALCELDFPVIWTHIGDGPLMRELQTRARSLPGNVKANWVGRVEPDEVLEFFVQKPVDLFVNVSESEGAPFSVMEALSASVPVIATNVGGTGEIVNESVGKTLPSDVTPEQLAGAIANFHRTPRDTKLQMRRAAKERFGQMFDASVLANEFAKWLAA